MTVFPLKALIVSHNQACYLDCETPHKALHGCEEIWIFCLTSGTELMYLMISFQYYKLDIYTNLIIIIIFLKIYIIAILRNIWYHGCLKSPSAKVMIDSTCSI